MTTTSITLLVAGILLVVFGVLLLVVRKLRLSDPEQFPVLQVFGGVKVAGPVGLVVIVIGVVCIALPAFIKPTGATNVTTPPVNPTVPLSSSPTSSSASPSPTGTSFIGHIVEWANSGGQPTSWLVTSNGERNWIPNTSIYYCLVKAGHTDLGRQPPAVLDDLPDLGKWASCPATVHRADYIGHIVEWGNGGGQPNTSWLVGNNGERYWIPSTSIFYCLVKAGHTDLGRQPPAVLDDLPDLGQRASCG